MNRNKRQQIDEVLDHILAHGTSANEYTAEQLAEILNENGLDVTVEEVQEYLDGR